MTLRLRPFITGLLFLGAPLFLRALDGPTDFTLDLPFGANEATPAWLGHPVTVPGTFATLDLPVTPPDGAASLLLTIFYQEKTGGFLRISWQSSAVAPPTNPGDLPGPGEAALSSVLCDNFYEGIGMSNQRSLLIAADTMKSGSLRFQTGDTALGISRIKLEWLQSSTGLSSPAINDVLVTPASGKTQMGSDLAGTPPTASDPAWHDRIVDVPVTDVPLRIEQGVDFTVQLQAVPLLARLAVKESGLPWGQHLVVWLNNQRAGVLFPNAPELGDGGYPAVSGAPYVGWREGTFFVPIANLAAGNNALQFSAEPDVAPATPPDPNVAPLPLAVKDVVLQLDYPPGSTAIAGTATLPAPASVTTPPAASAPLVDNTPPASPPTTPDPDTPPSLPPDTHVP
jgi:hypothetical protein